MKDYKLLKLNMRMFAANTNVTTDSALSAEMKVFYETELIKLAEAELVHDQFGQKKPIPQGKGKTIEFRKYSSLPKALTPLTEGVTPDGQKLSVSKIEATVAQYGGYVTLSDMLILTAVDNNIMEATELIAGQAGRTLDTVTREVLNGGTNVQYGNGAKSSRNLLVGGSSTASANDYLSVDCIKKAVRALKHMNAPKINGSYASIINPDCSYDLMNDSEWKYPHQYVDTQNVYNGEIGAISGVRFVESTEAKVFHAADLASDTRTLAVNGAVSASATVAFDGSTAGVAAHALKGRKVIIYDATNGAQLCEVSDNTTTALTLKAAITCIDNAVIYPGEAGAEGRDVYSTLVLGANAYGVTEVAGGGLKHIVKQLGSGEDPLDQRATVGWKATKVAERLVEEYMVRIETTCTFQGGAN